MARLPLYIVVIAAFITLGAGRAVMPPDPYWHAKAWQGIKGQRDAIPVPVEFVPDPNPEAVPIPAGAPTVKFGVVVTNAAGYYDISFNTLHHQGLSTFAMQANKQKLLNFNGSVHYVDLKVLSGGPDCSSFLITYEYLISVVGVDFLFMPVNPNCTQLVFLAEAYEIPILNAPDFALAIYQQIPGLPFIGLNHTYSVSANYSLLVPSCLIPLQGKAKTMAIVHAGSIGQDAVPAAEAAMVALGFKKAMNTTYLDIEELRAASSTGDVCDAIDPTIEALKKAKPDILYYSLGETYTDAGILCMHKKRYYPPAFFPFASSTVQNNKNESWETSLAVLPDMWLGDTNATDPVLVSVTDFTDYWTRLWGTSQINLISYSATSSSAGSVALLAINAANSTDPYLFREAMHSLRVSTVIGDLYLVEGTQVFNHPFFCRQQGNGPTVDSTTIIFPPDSPQVVPVVYPANTQIIIPASFLDSLSSPPWWTTGRKVGVGLGITFGVLLLAALIAGAIFVKFRYHAIFIPKGGAKETDHW